MAEVAFEQASRVYDGQVRAVDRLDLEIADGELLVLVGPSGSGKSTALRMLAGLEDTDEGAVRIGGRDVTEVSPKDRDIAMVFQSYALYPHMTVAENMDFALRLARMPKAERRARVERAAEMLDLTAYLHRKPKALSGGQRQRVAMGRAIVREPSVFLMDEPLSNLDAKLRVETRANIAALQRRLGTTTVYVTHDQTEAMTMGDRVAVLRDGVLQQCDTPRRLYDRPANAFVAAFIGSPAMNLLPASTTPGGVRVDDHDLALPDDLARAAGAADGPLLAGVRPERLRVEGPSGAGIPAVVTLVEELGADTLVHAALADDTALVVRAPGGQVLPGIGEAIRCAVDDAGSVHVFDRDSGARVGAVTSS